MAAHFVEDDLSRLMRRWPRYVPELPADDVHGWSWHDAPPEVLRQALMLVDPDVALLRPNSQPPNGWLVDRAEQFGGVLGGFVCPSRRSLRIDSICVPGTAAKQLAAATATWLLNELDRSPTKHSALDIAVIEGWAGFDATEHEWEAVGSAWQDRPTAPVVSFWWD